LIACSSKLDLSKNKKFVINTGDNPINKGDFPYTVLSNSTKDEYLDIPIPCFVYDHWNEVKIDTWENATNDLLNTNKDSTYNKAIWIGAPVTQQRVDAFYYFNLYNDVVDFWLMNWDAVRNEIPNAKYLSFSEMQDYKILYDLPGIGFSARTCYFFYMRRPIIKLWDGHIMWFNEYLTDNSIVYAQDYDEMISYTKTLLNNKELYNEIVFNTLEIGKKYLSKDNALNHLTNIINNI